jgi:hypothetical protein
MAGFTLDEAWRACDKKLKSQFPNADVGGPYPGNGQFHEVTAPDGKAAVQVLVPTGADGESNKTYSCMVSGDPADPVVVANISTP